MAAANCYLRFRAGCKQLKTGTEGGAGGRDTRRTPFELVFTLHPQTSKSNVQIHVHVLLSTFLCVYLD